LKITQLHQNKKPVLISQNRHQTFRMLIFKVIYRITLLAGKSYDGLICNAFDFLFAPMADWTYHISVLFEYAVGFRPFSILFCHNQCKLAKVRVRPHDFQYIRETAYNIICYYHIWYNMILSLRLVMNFCKFIVQ
jgi:hypothetical protein